MIKITLATSNPHKLKEINEINKGRNIVFELIKGEFAPVENGVSFEENAAIKAIAGAKISKSYCLADDSGLCADALGGRPGIYSSRYAETPEKRIEKLLSEMKGVPFCKRGAHFTCAMALAAPDGGIIHTETGRVFGFIDETPKGARGFGYDPVFYIEECGKTMAELKEQEKNKISHRAAALFNMLKWIEKNL